MILPIVGYGSPVLRKEAQEITKDYPNLKELVANMYETMYAADVSRQRQISSAAILFMESVLLLLEFVRAG